MVKAKRAKAKAPARRKARAPTQMVDPRVAGHVRMVVDPCNATISPTAYRGRDGFITRFSLTVSGNLGASPVGIVAYWPRINRYIQLGLAGASTGFSLDWGGAYSADGPGGAFLATTASAYRPVAACLQSLYTGTELDRQGCVAQLVVPQQSTTGTVSIESLTQLAQRNNRTSGMTETKWIPSPCNENYERRPATLSSYAPEDADNIIVHVFNGFAANKAVFINRMVAVLEWQPNSGQGIVVQNPATPDSVGGLERVRSTLSRLGDWWLSAASTASTAIHTFENIVTGVSALSRSARTVYNTARIAGTAAPLLLTM